MHPETWNHFCEQLIQLDGQIAGLSWMNFGPSVDTNNEYNLDKHEIKILEGAITDVGKHVQAG